MVFRIDEILKLQDSDIWIWIYHIHSHTAKYRMYAFHFAPQMEFALMVVHKITHGIVLQFKDDCFWNTIYMNHYDDVRMGAMVSQITSLTIVYSTVYSGADQNKHQSSASLVFVWGIHRGPLNSPHKWPVTQNMFPFDDIIMIMIIKSSLYIIYCCLILLSLLPYWKL